jgi:hypothetical protein
LKYLRIKNWEKFQHDSTKPLPWIKFFTALLAPTKEPWYSELPDATKTLLHHIWLMGRVFNGRIPETWLTKEKLNLKSRVNLDPLLDSGSIWFEDESGKRLPPSHARDARSGIFSLDSKTSPKEREREGEPFDRDAEFETLWGRHPRPVGKKAARKHFDASVLMAADLAAIRQAQENYLGSARVRRGVVQDGGTWFNNWRDWENYTDPEGANGADSIAGRPRDGRRDRGAGPGETPSAAKPTSAKDFGHRTAADILGQSRDQHGSAEGVVHPVPQATPGGPDEPVR